MIETIIQIQNIFPNGGILYERNNTNILKIYASKFFHIKVVGINAVCLDGKNKLIGVTFKVWYKDICIDKSELRVMLVEIADINHVLYRVVKHTIKTIKTFIKENITNDNNSISIKIDSKEYQIIINRCLNAIRTNNHAIYKTIFRRESPIHIDKMFVDICKKSKDYVTCMRYLTKYNCLIYTLTSE